jgi:hypothetical protein
MSNGPEQPRSTEAAIDPLIDNLLVAMLAVNSWPVQRAWVLRGALRELGLMDLDALAQQSEAEVTRRLVLAGHTRGDYMNTNMALRILSMAHVLTPEVRRELSADIQAGRRDAANATLARIRGVGPSVLRTFWALQQSESTEQTIE